METAFAWSGRAGHHPPSEDAWISELEAIVGWTHIADPTSTAEFDGRCHYSPTWFKNLTRQPYSNIWKQARKEIRAARVLIVVGYSVPDTDLFAKSLLRVEAGSKGKRKKLDLLVLVNPDCDARRRFVSLIEGALERTTRILEFESLAHLVQFWVRNAAGRRGRRLSSDFMRPLRPSPELARIVGQEPLSRTEITKRVWAYIKRNGLQDNANLRMINPDPTLGTVFGSDEPLSMFEMTKALSRHVTRP